MYNIDAVSRIKIWGFSTRMGEGYIFEFFVSIIKCLLHFLNSKWSAEIKVIFTWPDFICRICGHVSINNLIRSIVHMLKWLMVLTSTLQKQIDDTCASSHINMLQIAGLLFWTIWNTLVLIAWKIWFSVAHNYQSTFLCKFKYEIALFTFFVQLSFGQWPSSIEINV